ncbi:MAG TPA: MBL fold metallo-hydrolase [Steroidobacteraceae bacterium]|jgi:glyoxylase-like metal-dependent hydrolase (beta-lactamase superfamily II)|nr:MBL fold metallo-hydrolase [Steroidobacteraceae bacterium]
MVNRRTVLRGVAGGLLGASLSRFSGAASGASPGIVRLNDRMAVVSGVEDNVLALSTSDGLLIVDSGSPAYTEALLDALRGLSGAGHVHTLINTHWHADQTGANEALGKAGTRIISQAKTQAWICTDHYNPVKDRYEKALPRAAWPTETFYSTGAMTAGEEHIEYGYLVEAHTDGDCYVYFRDSNVLAVGHVLSPVQDPQLDWYGGGWLGSRLDALTLLYNLANDQTRIVPAYGPPVARSSIKAEHAMLQAIYSRMVDLMLKGRSAEDIFNAGVMNGSSRTWNDPRTFVYSAFHGLWGHHYALSPTIL